MKLSKKTSLFGAIILAVGLGLIAFVMVQNFLQRQALAGGDASPAPIVSQQLQSTVNTTQRAVTGIPSNISINSIDMDLTIKNGVYDEKTGKWNLSHDAAYYAAPTSPLSSAPANTLIYGHNEQAVFASLFKLKAGDQAVVKADNGYEFVYTFAESKTIKPTDVSILNVGDKPQITLQTCTGMFDQYREVFIFYLSEYRQA